MNSDEILRTEFSDDFITGMKNRMVVSFYKYGSVSDAYPEKLSALKSLQQRLEAYILTKNTEYLIDAANFAMIEFMFPSISGAFFKATDDDGSPGRKTRSGTTDRRANDEVGTNPESKTAKFR